MESSSDCLRGLIFPDRVLLVTVPLGRLLSDVNVHILSDLDSDLVRPSLGMRPCLMSSSLCFLALEILVRSSDEPYLRANTLEICTTGYITLCDR